MQPRKVLTGPPWRTSPQDYARRGGLAAPRPAEPPSGPAKPVVAAQGRDRATEGRPEPPQPPSRPCQAAVGARQTSCRGARKPPSCRRAARAPTAALAPDDQCRPPCRRRCEPAAGAPAPAAGAAPTAALAPDDQCRRPGPVGAPLQSRRAQPIGTGATQTVRGLGPGTAPALPAGPPGARKHDQRAPRSRTGGRHEAGPRAQEARPAGARKQDRQAPGSTTSGRREAGAGPKKKKAQGKREGRGKREARGKRPGGESGGQSPWR